MSRLATEGHVLSTHAHQAVMDRAASYLITNYNPKGNRIGWLMMASILVEAWDLYSIAFVLIFIRDIFHPSPALLGLAAAGTQGGAVIGALFGGWLADKLGRRVVFLSTMGMFVVFALVQAFVPNVEWLVAVRFILGIPLGSDISSGYTYIMESMPRGEREVMGNRWQFMFALGQVLCLPWRSSAFSSSLTCRGISSGGSHSASARCRPPSFSICGTTSLRPRSGSFATADSGKPSR